MKKIILTALFINTIAQAGFAEAVDPFYPKQWALKNSGQLILRDVSEVRRTILEGIPGIDINWVDTKDIKTDKKELIVAVLDSGLDITHPDLKDRIWYNSALCAGAPNAANLACNGFNFLDNNNILTDDVGHGTHVAGVIAANRNSIGIAGAGDPRLKIMPLKVLNSQVNGFVYNGKVITDVIADALTFAVKNGAQVVNLSLGWPKLINLDKVKKAFEYAEQNNVIVIAATGNNDKDLPTFPCSYENVVCVGAIDNRGDLTDFTNFGSKVDLVAPGESIISTLPINLESRVLRVKNYESKRGSSQAAPYVTAAVATLKLLHPELTNDQVRSLLFRSTRPMNKQADGRFTKFGMLDMKNMIALADQGETSAFVNPQIKNLTEVKFTAADRKFAFNLDLKNLSSLNYQGKVCIKSLSSAVSVDQECFDTSIEASKLVSLPITGNVEDLGSDSHILFQVQIDQRTYQMSVVFSRDLNNDSAMMVKPVGQASFADMAAISGDRRLSRMSRVLDKNRRIGFPEYFYLETAKQTATNTNISLLTAENGNYQVKNILLPKLSKVISIHRQDINLDGKMDYFIYTLANNKEIQFFILDEKLNPLFKGGAPWSMAISTFEGLPVDGGVEKFEWLKMSHPTLGNILVPSIYRSYTMPEADNSKIISERVLGAISHQFYLNPVVGADNKVTIDLRVIDSVKMTKSLGKILDVLGSFDIKTITLLKPFPQTDLESRNGKIRSLLAVSEDGVAKLYQVSLSLDGDHYSELTPLFSQSPVGQSLIYPVTNARNGATTKEAIFTTLLDRATAVFLVKNDVEIGSILRLQQAWENPIIALTAIFQGDQGKTYLVENRSSVTMLRDNGEKMSLPVYRDSSFPGQSFSETLQPILSEGRPGIYINSTLIYGERLYSMVDTKDHGFIRPLKLSIGIPQGCVPLAPETLTDNSQFNYVFLCTDAQKNVSMKFLPMSHN
jgi:cell wall-associated protease